MVTTAGGSYNFANNSTSYINYTTYPCAAATAYSFSCWVYFKTIKPSSGFYCGETTSYYFYSGIQSNFLTVQSAEDSSNFYRIESNLISTTLFSTNTWYNIAFTCSAVSTTLSNYKIYINGSSITIKEAQKSGSPTSINNFSSFVLGSLSPNFYMFDGDLAHINFWTTSLSNNQILEVMKNPLAFPSTKVFYVPFIDSTAQNKINGNLPTVAASATLSTNGPPVFYAAAAA